MMKEISVRCETWRTVELTFESEIEYADPFWDVSLDLFLSNGEKTYIVPGFWDGGNVFRIRFAVPQEGAWQLRTVCSDPGNAALHGRTGVAYCRAYDGTLEIYRRGFVTTRFKKRYFTYDDGAPFFYLGDTHWSLGDETPDMVREISKKRSEQGFSVWQSEPIGAKFNLANGVTQADIPALRDFDEKFRIIADAGLLHANAQFFFPNGMEALIDAHGGYAAQEVPGEIGGKHVTAQALSAQATAYLERLSRYWVARYGAFPVLWTLGQEVDDDFYWKEGSSRRWNAVNNPYKIAAAFIRTYDAYDHPLTAHQENAALVCAYGNGAGLPEKRRVYADVLPSAFRDVPSHSFYAAQWSPALTKRSDMKTERDFWHNGQGKPVVNYEGRYCFLWTKDFGSRMQGWASFLSGMCGYGWGAQDTWSYLNTYNEGEDTDDGVDVVTSAEKTDATWLDALEWPSAYQVCFMRRFFESITWEGLIPRFDNPSYFRPDADVYAYCAGNRENDEIVLYFYSFTDPSVAARVNTKGEGGFGTGTVGRLAPSSEYRFRWFDPIGGSFIEDGVFTSSSDGKWRICRRPRDTDLTLLIRKNDLNI